ncbi:TadE/TadG family type IV pilus assembly protein [Tropicimonas sp. IMCC6043]|uniref:TadE/TadG family type IV pilus assembly protein n=1 Tax=Tropicimonas sp. IMCC6043 TaxID=2510645 RepID=UPI0013EABA2D|nr:Tad domain-containing protein [Tropicimonas sp. IMCC6043]
MLIHKFLRSDGAAAGIWSIFVFLACAVVAGLAVDGTNALRAREQLQSTADIAAHAGIVELAKGGSRNDIRAAVAASVESNMPRDLFGNPIGASTDAIAIGSYEDGKLVTSSTGDDDTVALTLIRAPSLGNAVPTFLLKLVGLNSWTIVANSAATFGASEDCAANDGIFARGGIKMTSTAEIGADFCFYSKEYVEMSNHNAFLPDSHVGMPDLADCSHCTDDHNPGVEDARFASNLILEDVGEHIDAVVSSLLGTSSDSAPKDAFESRVTLGYDMTPLTDLGYPVAQMKLGAVISISAGDFETLDFVPAGLIYAVYCDGPLDAYGAVTPIKLGGEDKTTTGGGSNANVKTLSLETGSGVAVSDVAVVTDCRLDFGNTAEITNAVIATVSNSNQSVSASSQARIGSRLLVCPSTEKVVIMSKGDMSVPAGMETNNVDFYIVGDVHLASGTSTQSTKLGTSFYVGGEMHIAAQGSWHACGDKPDPLDAEIKVMRHVIVAGS